MSLLMSSPHGCKNYRHSDREDTIERIIERLMQDANSFDAIAVCGASMMLIATVVAYQLGKNVILVRKQNEECISSKIVEGPINQRYIIVDDLIASGRTLKYVIEQIELCLGGCTLIGVGTYFATPSAFKSVSGYGASWIEMFKSGKFKFYDLTPDTTMMA